MNDKLTEYLRIIGEDIDNVDFRDHTVFDDDVEEERERDQEYSWLLY